MFHIQPSALSAGRGSKPIAFNLGAGNTVNAAFAKLTRKPLPPNVLQDAFSRMEPRLAAVSSVLATAAAHAKEPGFIPDAGIQGLVALSALDEVRGAAKQ